MDVRTALAIGLAIFSAGVAVGGYKVSLRHLNGLGRKQQAARDEQEKFERRVVTALIRGAETQEERDWLAEHFRE